MTGRIFSPGGRLLAWKGKSVPQRQLLAREVYFRIKK
jgi:hypothetical protein